MIRYIEWLREGLQEPGKTQRGLAQALRIDPSAVNRLLKGTRRIKVEEIPLAADYMGIPPPNHGEKVPTANNLNTLVDNSTNSPLNNSTIIRPRDVPILGHAKAGVDGLFIDNGVVRGFAVRPDSLEGVADAYAVFVQDDSMFPAFKPGKLAYVNPIRPVQPGDDVVIQLHDEQALIKTLGRRTEKAVIFQQYNPPSEIRIKPSEIKSLHFIATTDR